MCTTVIVFYTDAHAYVKSFGTSYMLTMLSLEIQTLYNLYINVNVLKWL